MLKPTNTTVNVPLVGQPLVVNEFNVLASITCRCQDANTPLLILGVGMSATCPSCWRSYLIGSLHFDRATGPTIHGTIGCVITHEANHVE